MAHRLHCGLDGGGALLFFRRLDGSETLTSYIIRFSRDPGTEVYTIKRVVSEERAGFKAAATLADRQRTVELRAPDAGLDAQRRGAYARLVGRSDLVIVTGIAVAGKSRLQRDVAAAYMEAGFRVIGTAVARDAARDRDRFDSRTVLMIEEAGTLGAAQARDLFERRAMLARA